MAEEDDIKSKSALARLTPNSTTIVIDGQVVRVATDKAENAILNMVLAAQGRAQVQRALKHWNDMEQIPSPKELRDIAGAIRDIAQTTKEIYEQADAIPAPSTPGKSQDPITLDFSKLASKAKKVEEVKEEDEEEEEK